MFRKFKKILISIWSYLKYQKSFSQDGEDIVLGSFFENRKDYSGFYVDVGAHHPVRFSNTLKFYKKNWRGINIDPTPGSMIPFRILRRRDINLEIGVGSEYGELTFYCFNEPALNTFDKVLAEARNTNNPYYITKEVRVPLFTLKDIFEKNLPPNQKIDFMSIDVEGLDLAVLRSNDWSRFDPGYILVEDPGFKVEALNDSEIYNFLYSKGYKVVAQLKRTIIFSRI